MSNLSYVLRRSLVPLATVLALVAVGCGGTSDRELEFLDQVRTAYPELSAADVSDERLLALASATCSPSALSPAEVAQLERLGVGRSKFEELALPLCPTR